MQKEMIFANDRNRIPEVLIFIRGYLDEKKVGKKNSVKTVLAAEEILGKICEAAEPGTDITVRTGGILNEVRINYSARGNAFTAGDIGNRLLFEEVGTADEESAEVMRNLIEKLFGESLNVHCDKGRINVKQQVKKASALGLVMTLSALVLGILAGYLLQSFAPAGVTNFMTNNIFSSVYMVLMNALKMIVAPLVFFSIASSIAEFSDLKALGRIAGRVVLMYILTSILAICVGILTYIIFPIGNPELSKAVNAEAAMETVEKGESAVVSIKDTLIGVVPTDIITPFQKSNMLQIIFMAVCLGLAVAALTKAVPVARGFVSDMNKTLSKITAGIVSFMPLMVFCSMAKMMATMNLSSFKDVIAWLPVVYIGDAMMIVVYLVLLLIFAGLNPVKFISKYYPAMISAFTLSSSNAALPSSIRQCKSLGVSEKVYSFSLPLGATINMDGSCITLMITALYFAKIYSLPMTGTMLLQLFIAIIVLSVGAPGVPGGNLVCLTLLIPQIGVPAEAISLVMGLYPVISMMQTMANVTGDAVVTTIAAKKEN